MDKKIHCILQIDEAYDAQVVECFEDYEEALQKRAEYEEEYTQDYYIDEVWLYKKGEEK